MIRIRDSPDPALRARCANAFSTTTTEPSTIRPIAIARPPSDIRFAESPIWFIARKVSSGVSTSVATTTSEERMSPRNSSSTTTTSTTPSSSTFTTVASAASTSSERS